MLTRVSSIETFRRYRLDDDMTPQQLVARLTDFQPTPAMLAGTAFHKALELAQPGEFPELKALGYTFLMPDAQIALPDVRELRSFWRYGQLLVAGQVDAIYGKRVEDHKTTASFRPDGYIEGCQWRFYLDIFDADVFRWNVFEIVEVDDLTYRVKPPHLLEQCRYPGLRDDCMDLAREFHHFAAEYMPTYTPQLEAA
ncbi:MAG: hypothetical protein M3Q51_04460 [Pseudomonadota bacterium]|nr:hypothetical protein [Pseudomonadota bacterium]MDQ3160261.1 hypothetical protein [Pseudomonadota bacterium]